MEFSRQECWSGLHFLLQRIFPTQGANPGLLHCRQILYIKSQGQDSNPLLSFCKGQCSQSVPLLSLSTLTPPSHTHTHTHTLCHPYMAKHDFPSRFKPSRGAELPASRRPLLEYEIRGLQDKSLRCQRQLHPLLQLPVGPSPSMPTAALPALQADGKKIPRKRQVESNSTFF